MDPIMIVAAVAIGIVAAPLVRGAVRTAASLAVTAAVLVGVGTLLGIL